MAERFTLDEPSAPSAQRPAAAGGRFVVDPPASPPTSASIFASPSGFLGPGVVSNIVGRLTGASPQTIYDWTTPLLEAGVISAAPELGVLKPIMAGARWRPIAGRIAASAALGAAKTQDIKGLAGGVAQQLVGEAFPLGVAAAQRVGARAFERLSDDLAARLITNVKAEFPWAAALEEGQQGFAALYKKGEDLVSAYRDQLLTQAKGATGSAAAALETAARDAYREGIRLIKGLRAMKALNPTTSRLDPEKLVKGAAAAMGGGKGGPETVWSKYASLFFAPGARRALEGTIPEGAAPGFGRMTLPWVSSHLGELRVGERAPFTLPYSFNITPTALERAARAASVPIGSAAAREATPLITGRE